MATDQPPKSPTVMRVTLVGFRGVIEASGTVEIEDDSRGCQVIVCRGRIYTATGTRDTLRDAEIFHERVVHKLSMQPVQS